MLLSIIAVLFTFGLVVFIHELGHFLAALSQKIRVDTFAFGFGPTIWKRKYGYTEYKINWIPLGGYVNPAGEDVVGSVDKPWEYFSKPWWSRLIVVVSGPLMNYVLAFVLFAGLLFVYGEPTFSDKPILGEVMASYPAEAAGLRAGDTIITVEGATISEWKQVAEIIHSRPEKPTELRYLRDGKENSVTVTPRLDPKTNFGLIGVSPKPEYSPVGPVKAVVMSAQQCWFWSAYTVKTLASEIYNRRKPEVAGPIGIVTIVSKAAHSGLENFVSLIALLSVAIGLFNLFPIPMLDGGTILLFLWEGISGRKLTEKLLESVNSAGMVILLCLLVFATYSDISRIRKSRVEKAAAEKAKAETLTAPSGASSAPQTAPAAGAAK